MSAGARPPEGGAPSLGEVSAQRTEGRPSTAGARPPEGGAPDDDGDDDAQPPWPPPGLDDRYASEPWRSEHERASAPRPAARPDAPASDTTAGSPQPFRNLDPDTVLDALEAAGLACDGRLQALNSFENRVYLVGLIDGSSRVAKFYRPGRWTDAQIAEEHAFAAELADAEIPVVAPQALPAGGTLFHAGDHRVAVYPRQGGRVPELDHARDGAGIRDRIGQFIARIHTVGARRRFDVRPALTPASHAVEPIAIVRASGLLPADIADAWQSVATQCAGAVAQRFDAAAPVSTLRLHGDCHLGNLLWTDDGPHFVDLDDARTGVAVQDLWMLADAGASAERSRPGASVEWTELIEGYERFRDFDRRELALVDALRTMRMLHYCAWLAQRWQDPAFPVAFPWFGTPRYWQDQVLALREQLGSLDSD